MLPLENINFISCGAAHSLVVLNNGEVFATGANNCGQLGLGHTNDIRSFTKIGLKDISICKCGEEYSIAVSIHCVVYSFGMVYLGLGIAGQLGYSQDTSFYPKVVEKMPGGLGTEFIACTRSAVLAVTRNFSTYA